MGRPSDHARECRFLGVRRESGQIVMPAVMLFPTLCLFIWLIYETTQLSSGKIRHQFAMDAAAFVEMTNYSDFLNRTAYVNGAFPMRIFEEAYGDWGPDCRSSHCSAGKMYAEVLFNNGLFPHLNGSFASGHAQETSISGPSWPIMYGGAGAPLNSNPPGDVHAVAELPQGGDASALWITTYEDVLNYWLTQNLAAEFFKTFVQIYSLLGQVEDAQFSVLKRLSTQTNHSFLQKSYWLNIREDGSQADAQQLAKSFDVALGDFTGSVHAHCVQKLGYCGEVVGSPSGFAGQYSHPECTPGSVAAPTTASCSSGLFQVEYVDQSVIKKLTTASGGGYPGLSLAMNWNIPSKNYWNIDFRTLVMQSAPNGNLHTTISLMGDPTTKPAVWPNPTPKFQVRQFP